MRDSWVRDAYTFQFLGFLAGDAPCNAIGDGFIGEEFLKALFLASFFIASKPNQNLNLAWCMEEDSIAGVVSLGDALVSSLVRFPWVASLF